MDYESKCSSNASTTKKESRSLIPTLPSCNTLRTNSNRAAHKCPTATEAYLHTTCNLTDTYLLGQFEMSSWAVTTYLMLHMHYKLGQT